MSKVIFGKLLMVILTVIIFSFLHTPSFAWDSIGQFTHRQMTEDALTLLSPADYPDINWFDDNLIEYSADEKFSHDWNIYANGGSPGDLWVKKILPKYTYGDYDDAYDYIGCILHLVQDQGVPAHAFDIQHVTYWAWGWPRVGDFLESYANEAENNGSYYSPGSISPESGSNPVLFYDLMISRTQTVVNTNIVTPPPGQTWSDYWQTGTFGPRQFPEDRGESWYVINHDNLVQHRIKESINYIAGNMVAASKSLPPLLKNLVIVPTSSISPQIDINNGSQISFQIFENRKSTITIFITLDSPSGPAIKDSSGNVYNGKSFVLSSGTNLPWEGNYSLTWKGRLSDNSFPSNGQHYLYVRVQDFDGNISYDSKHLFTIYTTPVLTISKTGSGAVTSSPSGIDCGSDCSQSFNYNTSLTLTAAPASGWAFDSWSGCDSTAGTTCYITMTGDSTVSAQFTRTGYWTIESVDNSGQGCVYTSTAIDSSGKVHISYGDDTNHNLKYATNVSGLWTTQTVDSSAYVGYYTAIATDSGGKIHISYYDWGNYNLKYATNASGTWIKQTIDITGEVGSSTDIAIDSSDKAHISYSDWTNYDLKYATNATGPWVKQTIDSSGRIAADENTSIAIDLSDRIHIAYYDYDNKDLKYATNASGSWIKQTIDSSGYVGSAASIAIDSSGWVHISYASESPNYNLKYATNASGSWVTQAIDNNYWAVGDTTSIAIDPWDNVHISYYNFNNDLKYATNASGQWVIETVDSVGDVGIDCSIALDQSGGVHISYCDWTTDKLKYATSAQQADKYTLIVNKSGSGSGTITSNPSGIDCGGVCRESYDQDSVLTLAAAPDINSTFNGWNGGGCSGTGTCQISLTGDTTVTAAFTSKKSTITAVFDSGKGVISPPSALVTYGDDQTFSITPNTGYHITNVVIDGSTSVDAVPAYTFSNVISAHTIEASFAINTYLIAGSAGRGGTVSPSQTTVNYGGSQLVSIISDPGYHVADVLIDGVSIGPISSNQFINITADHLIEAFFELNCTPIAPDDATCDGIDDDCDDLIDEDYAVSSSNCGIGACASTGQLQCQSGQVVDTCTPGTPAPNDSLCNGIDDDCNGQTDEDYLVTPTSCGTGSCSSIGERLCQNGVLINTCVPWPPAPDDSTCDGIDDDCNGQTDEDYPMSPTNCGIGSCFATGQLQCQSAQIINTCTPGMPQTEGPYSSPTCSDSVDNDCDGLSDLNDPACPPPPSWTDDIIVPGETELKAVHITELRIAVNFLRNKRGFASYNWTDTTLTPQSNAIKAIHIIELRTAIAQAIGTQSWSESIDQYATLIRRIHIQELRDAVENAW